MAETFLRSPFTSVEKITEQAEGGVEVAERSLERWSTTEARTGSNTGSNTGDTSDDTSDDTSE